MARKKANKQIPIENNNRKAKEENKMTKKKEMADTLNNSLELSRAMKKKALDMAISAHDGKFGKDFEMMAFNIAFQAHDQETNILKAKSLTEKGTPEDMDNHQELPVEESPIENNHESGMEGLGALFS